MFYWNNAKGVIQSNVGILFLWDPLGSPWWMQSFTAAHQTSRRKNHGGGSRSAEGWWWIKVWSGAGGDIRAVWSAGVSFHWKHDPLKFQLRHTLLWIKLKRCCVTKVTSLFGKSLNHNQEKYTNLSYLIELLLVFPVCSSQVPGSYSEADAGRSAIKPYYMDHRTSLSHPATALCSCPVSESSAVVWCWVAGVARRSPYGPKKHQNPLIPHHQTRTD